MMRMAPLAAIVMLVLGLGGCGDSIRWSSLHPGLMQVSFIGYSPAPGPPPVPVPPVFRDQALEFTFDSPLDDSTLGGFLTQGGAPLEMLGVAAAGSNGVPYYPYADQARARDSLQIRKNEAGAAVVDSYVVGRHRDRPDTVVVDPKVDATNPFGLAPSLGFDANTVYVYRIPADNGFRFLVLGQLLRAAPAGTDPAELPILVPPYSTAPELSRLFFVSFSYGPDPTPPEVLSIEALSGAQGTDSDPVAEAESFVVTFSRPVTAASIDLFKNFIVRNDDVINSSYPFGILVPGSLANTVPGATAGTTFVFTPVAPYGPGVAGHGFDIEVRIGSIPYPQPITVVPPILGVPTGISGTQLPLSNSLARTFRTTPCSGCSVTTSIVEDFVNAVYEDVTFVPTFGPPFHNARWNDASLPGELAGRLISGSPSGALGTRIQFQVSPQPENISPAGLFAPFDASAANSGNQCGPQGCNLGPSINPNGGSHIMHIYEYGEGMMSIEDSLEQIEWAPVNGVTAQTIYPQYSIWCGVSNIAAPLSGGPQQGLNAVFDSNYTLLPYQAGFSLSPACAPPSLPGARKVPCGLAQTYIVNVATSQYYPFPLLSPPFDFATSTGASGVGINLLFEQNIEPGQQVPNFNRYRATAFQPVRRLIDGPLSLLPPSVCPFNHGGGFDVYRTRFTFVGVVSQARSLWYDTGTADPDYVDFVPTPPVSSQPVGTSSTWILEGTDVLNPVPGTVGASGVFIDANGVTHPTVLTSTIAHLRYFRFRVELRANNVTNATPAYTSVVMAYGF